MAEATQRPLIFGHRGTTVRAPENTLAAFDCAAQAGADGVEFDVHLSADGVPVVIHDATLDRTTTGSGPVGALDAAALERLDAGSRFGPGFVDQRLPTLAAVLARCRSHGLAINIEFKPAGSTAAHEKLVAAVIAEIERSWPLAARPDSLICSSFHPEILALLKQARPHWPRGLLFAEGQDARQHAPESDLIALTGANGIGDAGPSWTAQRLAAYREQGLWTGAYALPDSAAARLLVDAGLQILIVEDPGDPAWRSLR